MQGIRYGFQIGFDYNQRPQLSSKSRNMGSAYEHPEGVAQYLTKECRLGRVAAQSRSHRRCSFKSAASELSPNGANRTSGV